MKRGRNAPQPRRTTKKPKVVFVKQNRQQMVKAVPERKYFDSTRTGLGIFASTTNWAGAELDPAALFSLFAPIQGDDIFNRQGRKVQVLNIKISGQIGCPAQAGLTNLLTATIIKLALVQDTQTNGIALVPQQVFGATNGTGEPTDMYQNPAFFGKFKVLKTLKIVMEDPNPAIITSTIDIQGLAHLFKMNVKFKKPVVVHYNTGNAGNIADVVDNSFHFIGICTDASLKPLIAYRCRTTFIDV